MVAITLRGEEPRQLGCVLLVDPGKAARAAGVVDEASERSERLRRLIEQTVKRGRVGDVGFERLRPAARLHDRGGSGLGSLGVRCVVDGDRIAVGGEAAADRRADPARASGDDDEA